MKKIILIAITSALLAVNSFAVKAAVAVLEFEAKGLPEHNAQSIGEIFRSKLVNSGQYSVLDRKNMDAILKEQELQLSGCTASECAVEIGRLLNMQYMLYGTVMKLSESYIVSIGFVDIESGGIISSANVQYDDLDDSAKYIEELIEDMKEYNKATRGHLSIVSKPEGVKVFVDGVKAGITPCSITLDSGRYDVVFSKNGYISYKTKVRVREYETEYFDVYLEKETEVNRVEYSDNDTNNGGDNDLHKADNRYIAADVPEGVTRVGDYMVGSDNYKVDEETGKLYIEHGSLDSILAGYTIVPVNLSAAPYVSINNIFDKPLNFFSLNIFYGQSASMLGASFGLVHHVEDNFIGYSMNAFIQVDDNFYGLAYGGFNFVMRDSFGAMLGIYNRVGGSMNGFQAGVVNQSRLMNGVQIGLVNWTEKLVGLQIGLANFSKNGPIPFSPFINVGWRY